MVSDWFTCGSLPSISRTSSGAAATDSTVATSSSAVASVTSRRTNAVPPSGSSRSARASTGTKIAVNVASSTSAATRFGSWLATENALDSAAPRIAASSTMRMNPVIRLTSVANAMPHDRDTTAASDSSAGRRVAAARVPAGCAGAAAAAASAEAVAAAGSREAGGGGDGRAGGRPTDRPRSNGGCAARRAGPRYSCPLLFARWSGVRSGSSSVVERDVERIRAVEVGPVGLAAEPVPQPSPGQQRPAPHPPTA